MADTPTQVTQSQIGFAPEIAPYAQQLLGQAQALTDTSANPYMQYQGERVAQFSPLQNQSYQKQRGIKKGKVQGPIARSGIARNGKRKKKTRSASRCFMPRPLSDTHKYGGTALQINTTVRCIYPQLAAR